ncbi:helix-turn-helix domain-containing protein [Leuconostoc suionicum]|uniref:helix-turn-helix domain-containing protein n=1 Tax=Leuconostoc suionicum TaxID=1511761 RepID=UPI0024AC8341|nr:helix-turn-helix transcriptional regulator [Leuconostoc suionicum]MDI6650610.1 helix-turn-helix transcriptional regulator [Leuconostoc suionicum]
MTNTAVRIKNLRKKYNMSRKTLADTVGASVSSIESYELSRRVPSLEMLENLAKALHATTDYLKGVSDDQYGIQYWARNTGYSEKLLKTELEKLISSGRSHGDVDYDIAAIMADNDLTNNQQINSKTLKSFVQATKINDPVLYEQLSKISTELNDETMSLSEKITLSKAIDCVTNLHSVFGTDSTVADDFLVLLVSLNNMIINNIDDDKDYWDTIENFNNIINTIKAQNKKASDDKPETER